jgi:hypothetical protein
VNIENIQKDTYPGAPVRQFPDRNHLAVGGGNHDITGWGYAFRIPEEIKTERREYEAGPTKPRVQKKREHYARGN